MRQLVDGVLHPTDVLQLAAGMAVHELQAVLHPVLLERAEEIEDLRDKQPELRLLARGFAPAPYALGRELDTHADPRPDVVAARVLEDQLQLAEVLDHRDDGAAELGREDHGLDVAVVLEAVADDHPLRLGLGHRHHREQLGLRAHLEAETELAPVAVHLLHDEALLVHLDREHRRVAVAVVVLGNGGREGVVQAPEAVAQDVREPQHHWRREIASLESADDLVEIDLAIRGLVGAHHDVARVVDAEVAVAPGLDAVQIERVLDLPAGGGTDPASGAVHFVLDLPGAGKNWRER